MWAFEHLLLLTFLAAVAVLMVASAGFYLSVKRFPGYRATGQVITVTMTLALAIVLSVGLYQSWTARRERDQRVWIERGRHLQQLQLVLRTESESLYRLAAALREGRYFTLVANDARKAVWHDGPLTADVERHFPDYFRERERLIRDILEHDSILGRVRQAVSTSLTLTEAMEPNRAELVPALVKKCGGASPDVSFVRLAADSSQAADAARVYQQYPCTVDVARMCQALLERAADLADAASQASEAARRYAEETVLRGSCTYAPEE